MKKLYTETNIFDLPNTVDGSEAVCVTTNGIVKCNGEAVMGKGIALEAKNRFGKQIAVILADYLKKRGNHVCNLGWLPDIRPIGVTDAEYRLFTFPTKNNWQDKSIPELIKQSVIELVDLCDELKIKTCYLPPVGCSCGGLNFEKDVEPLIAPILDDRFIFVFKA